MTAGRCVQVSTCIVALLLAGTAICPIGSTLFAAGAETGTTSVSMSIDGPRLTIDLTTDGETLVAKLDRLAGRGRTAETAADTTADTTAEPLADAVLQRQAELLRHIVLQFDDKAGRETKVAQVQVETVTASATDTADELSPRITIRFSAVVPDAAGSVRWTYALASAAYLLTVRQGWSVVSETIAGADSSGPVALVNHQPPDTSRRFWTWAVPALFAALVTLRVRERRRDSGSLQRRSPVLSLSGPSSQRDRDQVKTQPEAFNKAMPSQKARKINESHASSARGAFFFSPPLAIDQCASYGGRAVALAKAGRAGSRACSGSTQVDDGLM